MTTALSSRNYYPKSPQTDQIARIRDKRRRRNELRYRFAENSPDDAQANHLALCTLYNEQEEYIMNTPPQVAANPSSPSVISGATIDAIPSFPGRRAISPVRSHSSIKSPQLSARTGSEPILPIVNTPPPMNRRDMAHTTPVRSDVDEPPRADGICTPASALYEPEQQDSPRENRQQYREPELRQKSKPISLDSPAGEFTSPLKSLL
ncbi:hypothetical protein J8273_2329 [Carpediemonas membranifera]|uniref:Uncharacterized protein n=1 Tax=Carpediemonas membranifera TaxID=201153 RepID=A0A8J6EB17_9EUKA|nr:hypothetical protein J8273_2329 [Carpediemonas membranifera]|eukprot:KAG9395980.1 hypothetical protein J8273_2329 [Carpediemonas membranifera]